MSKDNSDFFKKKNSWSTIKDELLKCYLAPYFQKVLMTKKPIFYVDCFAGQGKFEDGSNGSPLIALEVRGKSLIQTTRTDLKGAIKTAFIELNYADLLQKNIDDMIITGDKPEVIPGKYEEQIENLLKDKGGQNVFLYIDPYGIKALDSTLFDKFESFGFSTFEMLINFNSFGFFRDGCRVMSVDVSKDATFTDLEDLVEYDATQVKSDSDSEKLLTNIAGGDYWKNIVEDYKNGKIDGYKAEKRLSTEYKQRLKQRYSYVLDLPIRLKANQRPKYRMIHVCEHEDGCYLMAENMQRRKDELFLNIQNVGQLSLFDFDPTVSKTAEGEMVTKDEIKDKIRAFLKNAKGDLRIKKFIAGFCNEYGLLCDFKMMHEILEQMDTAGELEIVRNPATNSRGKSRFWDEKNGQTVTIRRLTK
ncbi:three-Cys-motif partner protein TcmP [Stomatobaculum longum]|uniref:three-Cys-motif partner protein TcmP n=1 Tax=Stomatobaculum longum TaxID=796942 RepID=UPI00288099D8|nr:three-Cys-motif partner protein TcmP [Stomatobaculum longum]